MIYTTVKDLQWIDDITINMIVNFEGLGEVPFTATSIDTESHGRELFARALAQK